jgi:hypothetical protein
MLFVGIYMAWEVWLSIFFSIGNRNVLLEKKTTLCP